MRFNPRLFPAVTTGILVGSMAACTGQIGVMEGTSTADGPGSTGGSSGGAGSSGTGGDDGGGTSTPAGAACDPSSPGTIIPVRIRRLSQDEFGRSVQALLGSTVPASVDFPPAASIDGYHTNVEASRVTGLLANNLFTNTPEIAAQLASALAAGKTCVLSGTSEQVCAATLIKKAATQAYRRRLADGEATELVGVYQAARADSQAVDSLAIALSAVLQSPDFLYRTELGSEGETGRVAILTAHEVAAQLSFLLTGAPPDGELLAAAEDGTLLDAGTREGHARRLLRTSEARTLIGRFAADWLEVSNIAVKTKDAAAFPQWTMLRDHLVAETQAFVTTAVVDDNASLSDLLQANWTIADDTVLGSYALGSRGGDGRVALPPGQRAGILSQRSVLATHAQALDDSPVQRGHFVRTRLLCDAIPPPPETLVINLPPPDPALTVRERMTANTASPSCQTCHALMNPIGYGFEAFDAMGRVRATDNGKPVDTTGELTGTDVDGTFRGVEELASRLASSEQARECFVRQWHTYANGISASTDETRAALAIETAPFASGSQSVSDLIAGLVRSDTFTTRCRLE